MLLYCQFSIIILSQSQVVIYIQACSDLVDPSALYTPHVTFLKSDSSRPLLSFLQRQTQSLGSAERPKWLQSSWPRRLRPAEWSSLCPCGHRGARRTRLCLRGHLAGLCSYPSNATTNVSTCFKEWAVMDFRKSNLKGKAASHKDTTVATCTVY